MIDAKPSQGFVDLRRSIDTLILHHGAWRVLRAAALALMTRPEARTPSDISGLSDHLRQDIGLGPASPDPRDLNDPLRRDIRTYPLPHERRLWDIRP